MAATYGSPPIQLIPFLLIFAVEKATKDCRKMISMYKKRQVLHYYIVNGYKAKRIHGIMRAEGCQCPAINTIKKIIRRYQSLLDTEGQEAADRYARSEDKFRTPIRRRTKLDKTACDFIEQCIQENKDKVADNNRKQCKDSLMVWRILREQMGYDISYSSVTAYTRDYIARAEPAKPQKSIECFVRQYHPAGKECQFDWGDVKLKIHGQAITVRMAVFTLPHSNHRMAYLFIREHTLAFKESHRCYFHDIGRIPQQMVYDNMRVAVKAFVGINEKEPTDALLDLSNFYRFEYRFCNAYSGNEKGNVEESVKVVRKEAFSVRDSFESLSEAQEYLYCVCRKMNGSGKSAATSDIVRLAQEDFAAMRPCKEDFACFLIERRKVNNYSVITVDNAYYSVPDRLTMQWVSIRDYTNKVEVLEDGVVVATHEKIGVGQWHIVLDHYLDTLSYKPGALKNAEALRQAPEELRKVFDDGFSDAPKDFIDLLKFARENKKTYEDIAEGFERLRKNKVKHITLNVMMSALLGGEPSESTKQILFAQDSSGIEVYAQQGLASLDAIMTGQTLNSSCHATM